MQRIDLIFFKLSITWPNPKYFVSGYTSVNHPAGTSVKWDCFGGNQSILPEFFNNVHEKKYIMNDQYIWHRNKITQLYFKWGCVLLHHFLPLSKLIKIAIDFSSKWILFVWMNSFHFISQKLEKVHIGANNNRSLKMLVTFTTNKWILNSYPFFLSSFHRENWNGCQVVLLHFCNIRITIQIE